MAATRLSVIMPMYNALPFAGAAIDSILTQTMGDFLFYIVDDGSTDASGDVAAQRASGDPRIRLIRQENQGIVASLNRMLEQVDTPFVARMDADDIALPERFARQLARMEADASLGALGTQFLEVDAAGRVLDANFKHPTGPDAVRAALQDHQAIANPTAMFRTSALRAAGLYRNAFRYCEDYDLFLRLSGVAEIDNLDDILMHYRRSPGQMSIANSAPQTRQAVYARLAHREREAGRPDPFADLAELPETDALDRLLGRPGIGMQIDAEILESLRFSVATMREGDFDDLCRKVASGVPFIGGQRAVLRCMTSGKVARGAQLGAALARARVA